MCRVSLWHLAPDMQKNNRQVGYPGKDLLKCSSAALTLPSLDTPVKIIKVTQKVNAFFKIPNFLFSDPAYYAYIYLYVDGYHLGQFENTDTTIIALIDRMVTSLAIRVGRIRSRLISATAMPHWRNPTHLPENFSHFQYSFHFLQYSSRMMTQM